MCPPRNPRVGRRADTWVGPYSQRKATIASTREARRAGT
jgi:hypothetical protein